MGAHRLQAGQDARLARTSVRASTINTIQLGLFELMGEKHPALPQYLTTLHEMTMLWLAHAEMPLSAYQSAAQDLLRATKTVNELIRLDAAEQPPSKPSSD